MQNEATPLIVASNGVEILNISFLSAISFWHLYLACIILIKEQDIFMFT